MAIAKRIFLFALTNIVIIATISIILRVLGIDLTAYGANYGELFVFCLVWGMGGSFISLLLSKHMAKWMMGVKLVDPSKAGGFEQELYRNVERLARQAGLSQTPEVGVYDSPEVNAFATGATRNSALVAVSTGLLHRMDRDAVEGVLGHEVAHVANGDMVTMTLIQGVVNAFVMFFARIAARAVARDERASFGLIILFQILFGFLGMMVVGSFSRWREFRADAGSARIAGKQKMITALRALQGTTQLVDNRQESLASLKISGRPNRILALLSTHPPLEERIAALEKLQV